MPLILEIRGQLTLVSLPNVSLLSVALDHSTSYFFPAAVSSWKADRKVFAYNEAAEILSQFSLSPGDQKKVGVIFCILSKWSIKIILTGFS